MKNLYIYYKRIKQSISEKEKQISMKKQTGYYSDQHYSTKGQKLQVAQQYSCDSDIGEKRDV